MQLNYNPQSMIDRVISQIQAKTLHFQAQQDLSNSQQQKCKFPPDPWGQLHLG